MTGSPCKLGPGEDPVRSDVKTDLIPGPPGQGSLVAEPVLGAAVGALPGDAVAGHAPLVFIHALLADGKAAPANPAKGECLAAAVAYLALFAASFRFSLFLCFCHNYPT